MNNLVEKNKRDDHSFTNKEQLISEITRIHSKLNSYKQMEVQMQQISSILKVKRQKPLKMSKQESSDNKNKRTSNANKKIKIYELQKKLDIRKKDQKEKHLEFMNKFVKLQEIQSQISNVHQQILEQKEKTKELNKLKDLLLVDIQKIQQEIQEFQIVLIEQKKIQKVYQQQKAKKIQSIKSLKKIIKRSSQQTEPDDQNVMSLNEQSYIDDQIENLNLQSQIKSPEFRRKYSEQNQNDTFIRFSAVNCKSPKISNQISLKNQSIYFSDANKSICAKTFQEVQDQILMLEQKIQNDKSKYEQSLKSFLMIKKGVKNFQASAKHATVTVELLKNRLQAANKNEEQNTKETLKNIKNVQILYSKLRQKQGKRGQLRGNLGIKVQNARMLSIINQQISLDLQKMDQYLPILKQYFNQCVELAEKMAKK